MSRSNSVAHIHIQAVYHDYSTAYEAAKGCKHSSVRLSTSFGKICCNCGLNETGAVHPGYFRVTWVRMLSENRS